MARAMNHETLIAAHRRWSTQQRGFDEDQAQHTSAQAAHLVNTSVADLLRSLCVSRTGCRLLLHIS